MTKTIALIVAAVLLVGGGVTVGVVVSNNNTPQNVVRDAIFSLANVVDREEFSTLYHTFTGGCVEINQTTHIENDQVSQAVFSAKVFFDQKGVVIQDLDLSVLEIDFGEDLWLLDDFVYIKSDALLQDALAWEEGKLTEQFKQSIFSLGSSKYVIEDQDTYEKLVKVFSFIDDISNKQIKEDLSKITTSYIKKLWNIFCEEVEFVEEVKTVVIDGKDLEARNINITIDAYNICKIYEKFLAFLQEDDQIVEFLNQYNDLWDIATNFNNEKDGGQHTEDETTTPIPTLSELYTQKLDKLQDNFFATAAEIKEEMDDDKVVVDVTTPKNKAKLLKLNVAIANDAEKQNYLTLDFGGKTIEDANKITAVFEDTTHVYDVLNGDQILLVEYTVDEEKLFSFKLDRDSEKYSLFVLNTNYSTTTISGTLTQSKEKVVITVDQFVHDNEYYEVDNYTYTTDLTITLKPQQKLPSKPTDYKTLGTITEEDVDSLLSKLGIVVD